MKFDHLDEKSENGSISNLSTKGPADGRRSPRAALGIFLAEVAVVGLVGLVDLGDL